LSDLSLDDVFHGSVDRFVEIAYRLQGRIRVLDVGAGHGMLVAFLSALGHHCHAVDYENMSERFPLAYKADRHSQTSPPINFKVCNIEIDPLPFDDMVFDAVVCCQVLEHFTHSHLHAIREIYRVLVPSGLIEIDVPNAASFRNRSRILRGRNITYDYAQHYLYATPVLYKNLSFYPIRHNREFTRDELILLLHETGFHKVEVRFLKSRRWRNGLSRLKSIGTAIKDLIPSFRKTLIGWGEK
jgi:ubiquinone/menaquinone biosynthesis C-methylase UbiE